MRFYDVSRVVEYVPVLINIEPAISTITIRSRYFERYVYRPIIGHDILVNQIPGAYSDFNIQHITKDYFEDTQEELYHHIQYDLSDYDNKNWIPFATKMSAYVCDKNLEGEHFSLEAAEGIGDLYVMDESKGWLASTWNANCQPQRTTDSCTVCLEDLPDNAAVLLGMKCGHVFHKECLTEWIWTNPGSGCPSCRAGFSDGISYPQGEEY